MYCSNCGAEIVGRGRFCSGCGTAVDGGVTMAATHTALEKQQKSWAKVFRKRWREFASSPLVVTMIICFSVVQLLNIMTVVSATDAIGGMMGIGGLEMESVIGEIYSTVEILKYIILLPGILIAAGMWMIYAEGTGRFKKYINTSGITIIQVVYILIMVAITLLVFLVLGYISSIEQMYGDYMADTAEAMISTFKIIIFLVLAICDMFSGMVICMLGKMRRTAAECEPQGAGWAFAVGVLSLLWAGIMVISMLSKGITLANAANCGYSILIGIVLCKYKSVMDNLEYMRTDGEYSERCGSVVSAWPRTVSSKVNVAPVQDDVFIPNWKRIRMAEQAAKAEEEQPTSVDQNSDE